MESNEKAIRVLLVDDDSDMSLLIKKKFSTSGFEVFNTIKSSEAVAMAHDVLPDVILLDLMMTELPGEEVLVKLKEDKELKKIPVLVFTNKGFPEDEDKFLEAGAAHFLIKSSTSLGELVDVVKGLAVKKS